jgi:hypothetical protein
MEIFDLLESYGVTPTLMQLGVVGIFVVIILGMYWQAIFSGIMSIIGIGIVLMIFCVPTGKHSSGSNSNFIEMSSPPAPLEYIKDCMLYTGRTSKDCGSIWKQDTDQTR